MDIVRISLLGIGGVVLGFLLKENKPEYSFYVSFGVGLAILFLAVGKIRYLFDSILKIKAYLPMDSSYVETLLKMVGITYIGEFSSGICKDAGYGAIGSQIEMFAKLAIMAVSMPILLALLETIYGFLS